jgi:hypothetical protein
MGVLGMNYMQMKTLKAGDIVYQKAGKAHGSDQDMGPLCVVLAITARGGVLLADTLTNARYWGPYEGLYLYPATEAHKELLWRRVGFSPPSN